MSKNVMKSSATDSAWSEMEELGQKIAVVRDALRVGNWAVAYQSNTIGDLEEMTAFFEVVDHYMGEMEHKCAVLCSELLNEKKAREGAA